MIQLDIRPSEIGIWCPYVKTSTFSLEEIVRKNGWKDIPRVPIFELPEKKYSHKYLVIDGHGRWRVANRTNTFLPCNLYEQEEFIDVEKDGLAPFRHAPKCLEPDFYRKLVFGYEIIMGFR